MRMQSEEEEEKVSNSIEYEITKIFCIKELFDWARNYEKSLI